ncbi:hypothetical protein IC582_010230 [Cucumis melo]
MEVTNFLMLRMIKWLTMLLLTRLELHLRINNNNTLRKCTLLDWGGTGEVVAEGRWSSNDLNVTVHHVPLGPHAVRVWVDLPKKSDAFLWRPNSEMTYIEDAVGSTVAWPLDKVILSMYILNY